MTQIHDKNLNKIIVLALAISVCLLLVLVQGVSAQETDQQQNSSLILTWESQSFYPSNYKGKAPATKWSTILVSATGVTGNTLTDISDAEFLWYLDGRLYERSFGANEMTFEVDKGPGAEHTIRLRVITENGEMGRVISVPVERPKTVIEYPYDSHNLSEEGEVILESTPYFFSAGSYDNLNFFWNINGTTQEERTRTLRVSEDHPELFIGQNRVTAIIANSVNQLESKRSNIHLNIE